MCVGASIDANRAASAPRSPRGAATVRMSRTGCGENDADGVVVCSQSQLIASGGGWDCAINEDVGRSERCATLARECRLWLPRGVSTLDPVDPNFGGFEL